MPLEPSVKRAISFVDGQNLFHACREAFGYTYPNYDVVPLAGAICLKQGWELERVHFLPGFPIRETIHTGTNSGYTSWRCWAAKVPWCFPVHCAIGTNGCGCLTAPSTRTWPAKRRG